MKRIYQIIVLLAILIGTQGGSAVAGKDLTAQKLDLNPESAADGIHVDAQDNLWISDYFAGELWRYDPGQEEITAYGVGGYLMDSQADGTGFVWWTDSTSLFENPPVAQDDSYSTDEDTPLTVPAPGVLSNDSDLDGDPLMAYKESNPLNGSVILNEDGSFSYTPAAGFYGSDSFTYLATDGAFESNLATVSITVNQVTQIYLPLVLN